MGQQQTASSNVPKLLKHTTEYHLDPRLTEYKNTLPSYFSASAEKIVQEITNMINEIPQHPLELYLTNAIDTRFDRLKANMGSNQSEVKNQAEWFQLSNQERFLNLLNLFAKQYAIEQFIQKEYEKPREVGTEANVFQTLRNPIKPPSTPTLNQQLIMRMLLRFYLTIIKTYANSGQKHIMRFHEQTGRQLCLLILKGHLSLLQLYGLFYQYVYIDKHPTEVANKLALINKSYHWKCLKTQYSINIEKKQLEKMQVAARLYLDQLYMSSLREAQDPQIKNSDDSLLPIKIFPISRVKDKPRS